jgi:hypothetical protein
MIHWLLVSALFAVAAWIHCTNFMDLPNPLGAAPSLVILFLATFFMLWIVTRVASWLTAWEARYRGLRMPRGAVLRAMYYHAAHYLPVALATLATVGAFDWRLKHDALAWRTGESYVVTLSVEVVIWAAYLFITYWAGMRNIMYANR